MPVADGFVTINLAQRSVLSTGKAAIGMPDVLILRGRLFRGEVVMAKFFIGMLVGIALTMMFNELFPGGMPQAEVATKSLVVTHTP
jgi:hypothetical protein